MSNDFQIVNRFTVRQTQIFWQQIQPSLCYLIVPFIINNAYRWNREQNLVITMTFFVISTFLLYEFWNNTLNIPIGKQAYVWIGWDLSFSPFLNLSEEEIISFYFSLLYWGNTGFRSVEKNETLRNSERSNGLWIRWPRKPRSPSRVRTYWTFPSRKGLSHKGSGHAGTGHRHHSRNIISSAYARWPFRSLSLQFL